MPDDPKIAEQEKRDAGREAKINEIVVNRIMASYEGRQWMWELLTYAAPAQTRYLYDGDVYAAMKRDGRAEVGGYLTDMITDICPERWIEMYREKKVRAERKIEREKAKNADPKPEVPLMTTIERMAEAQAAGEETSKPQPEKKPRR